jgi:soluble lytic murein transglycosylase-like protein
MNSISAIPSAARLAFVRLGQVRLGLARLSAVLAGSVLAMSCCITATFADPAGTVAVAETTAAEVSSPPAAPAPDRPPVLPFTARGPSHAPAESREAYRELSAAEAKRNGLPPELADSVMAVESGYNPGAIGGSGEIGLMQLLPSTARMLGFAGSLSDLAVPETNIHYGVTYLAQAWRLAGGDICTAVMKYRAGHGETRFSYLSVDYCVAVRAKLRERGYPITGVVPVATFGERGGGGGGGGGGGCGRHCLGVRRVGTVDLAALNTRLSTLVLQVRAGH